MKATTASRKPRVPKALPKGYYQSAFQHADVALSLLDPDLIILDANDRYCQLLAQPGEEVIGAPMDVLFSLETDDFTRQLRQAVGQSAPARFEANAVLKAGRKIQLSALVSRIDSDNEMRVLLSLHEVTDHQRAETSLRDSQKQLASIIASAMDAIITVDTNQRIVFFNVAAESLFRCRADAAIGRPLDDFIPRRFRAAHKEHIKRFEETKTTSRSMGGLGAISGLRADGEEFPIEASISQVEINARKLFTVIIRDITERQRAEEQLREQAALLDHATDAIMVKALDDRILYWNQGAERIYGWTAEEVVGRHIGELYNKDLHQDYFEAKRLLLERGEWSGEFQHLTKGGRRITIESRWTLVRDPEGRAKSVLVINTDATEKKRLAAQFLRAQRMESIGTLAGGIAHDLNNILSPILTALGLFELRFTDPGSKRMISVLKESAERGSGLISQVLSFARGIEGERVILQPKHLIKEVVKILKDTLPKNIDIQYSLANELWPVSGDATQIHQVLMNLLINARDAMPHGGKITIVTSNVQLDENYARMNLDATPGRFTCIAVADTGSGIAKETLAKIFDPFFTTKEAGKGTGLGLSTVLTIVKSHGGFINVYSEVGGGTEFKVFLPAAESLTDEKTGAADLGLPAGHGELILVVDDETAIREITKSTLEAYGYQVLTAADGTEAVALFAQHQDEVKLLLTDVMMPYLDGPSTIRAIRKMKPEIKVIISSGLKANEKEIDVGSVGAQIFLWKPYTADKLLQAIANLLNAK